MKINISLSIHYKDLYGKGFEQFMLKYKRVNGSKFLYVQFTNYADNTLMRTAYESPDHSDPIGVYGYPLDYVRKFPGDIWYGQSCAFLRVLQAVDLQKCLYLQSIKTPYQAVEFINGFYNNRDANEQYDYAKKWLLYNRYDGKINSNAKIAFSCVQFEFFMSGKSVDRRQRTSAEQTNLLLKVGYTSVVDTAKSHTKAVINDREPEQIVFLRRDAFKVIDVFNIGKNTKGSNITQKSDRLIAHKFAALLFAGFDDKLASFDNGKTRFWSKGGLRLELSIYFKNNPHNDLKFGQKRHRASTTGNLEHLTLTLIGPRGKYSTTIDDDAFEDEIPYIIRSYNKRPIDDTWEPESKASYEQSLEDAKKEKARLLRESYIVDTVNHADDIIGRYNKIATHYKLPKLNIHELSSENLYQHLVTLSKMLSRFASYIYGVDIKDEHEFSKECPTREECKDLMGFLLDENVELLNQYYNFCFAFGSQCFILPWYNDIRRLKQSDTLSSSIISYFDNIIKALQL